MYMYVSNERKGGLYIDLLMTVRYSHEAWEGHVYSANSHEAWKGRISPTVAYTKTTAF